MTETYSSENGPICPYCGKENSSAENDYWAEREERGERECDECEKVFKFYVDYTTHYYAEKTTDGRGQDRKLI